MDRDQPSAFTESRPSAPQRCARCGGIAPLIYVHGHAQCTACGSNILDCCQGAACDPVPAAAAAAD